MIPSKEPDTSVCFKLLADWSNHSERYWYSLDKRIGCYGTGYNSWGVQTNQKYLAAMATLGVLGKDAIGIDEATGAKARERALAALRFSLHSHLTGDGKCTDGTQWGHTWISALGIERMMHGVYLLEPFMSDEDTADLRRMLTSEADWLLNDFYIHDNINIVADPWNSSGANVPESNLWNGALLWRAAQMYPESKDADAWRERAHRFLINAVSVADDATDERIVAGKSVSERNVGANFHPNYALDHHGYLNVGYMVICVSNAAMLYFDMTSLGLDVPESLYHHQADLWRVLRKLIFADGRLARLGGDTRLRYTYCQEYLLPSLVFAGTRLGEPFADDLISAQLELIEREAKFTGDGGFYGKRLAQLAKSNPYYYTRLESDRACVLGMLAAYLRTDRECDANEEPPITSAITVSGDTFEESAAGSWCDPDHGVVMHRCATRLASFAWRAHGLAQGMCQPPDDGHLADWSQNLGGRIRFFGDDGIIRGGQTQTRELIAYNIDQFEGGFVTSGSLYEGVGVSFEEGWSAEKSALHAIAFVALGDAHTCIGLQYCRTLNHRSYVAAIKGMHLNLPNDLYNDFCRRLYCETGEFALECPPEADRVISLESNWVNIDGRVGVTGIYGGGCMAVHQSSQRRGGKFKSLYVDEVCYPCLMETGSVEPDTPILDVGWAVISESDAATTRSFAGDCEVLHKEGRVRAVCVRGVDGRLYAVLANFDSSDVEFQADGLFRRARSMRDLVTGENADSPIRLKAGRARAFALEE